MSDLEEKDTKRNVPKLRFPGFTDPWEQRKFSDLTDRVSIQSSDPDLPQVEYEDIISGEGTLNKDLRDKEGGKTGIKFYAGDVLYGKLRPYLMNWLYPQFNGVAVGDFWVLRATECDSSFLYRLIQTDSFQRLANVSSGSKMPRADWNLISQSFFAVPVDHAEQKVIAKSLAELDSLITLRQRELDHVKLMKRGLLQKMFPKDGADTPEIRFPGFADPWEQRKLGDMVEFYQGQTYSPVDIADTDGILVLRSSNVQHGQVVSNDDVHIACTVKLADNVRRNDIIVVVRNGSRSLIGKHALIRRDMPNTVIGAFMVGVRSEEPFFANALFDTAAFDKEIEKNLGATINQITGYMFGRMSFLVPSISEQRVVGSFFNDLDNLITLRQRELNHAKELKRGLLQKMFSRSASRVYAVS